MTQLAGCRPHQQPADPLIEHHHRHLGERSSEATGELLGELLGCFRISHSTRLWSRFHRLG